MMQFRRMLDFDTFKPLLDGLVDEQAEKFWPELYFDLLYVGSRCRVMVRRKQPKRLEFKF